MPSVKGSSPGQKGSSTRGGKRVGAGRPRELGGGGVPLKANLRDVQQREKFKRLGGSSWLRDAIDRAEEPDEKGQ